MANDNRNTDYLEGYAIRMYAKFQLHPPDGVLNIFLFNNLPYMSPYQPIK